MDREEKQHKAPGRYPGEPEPSEPPPPFRPLRHLIVDMEGGPSAEQRAERARGGKRERRRRRKAT